MARKMNYAVLILGFTSALGIAWLIRRQKEQPQYLCSWRGALGKRYGAEKARQLVNAARVENAALAAKMLMPESKVLRHHLFEHILPGLALYRVLLQEHAGDQPAALADVDDAFRAMTASQTHLLLAPFKVIPSPFRVLKLGFGQIMKTYPAEGWDFTFVENSDDRIAFNATRCYYLNTLTALGAPELTASFCKIDDVMAEGFPPSIRFIRDHTLGRGDEMCDFQYCRAGGS